MSNFIISLDFELMWGLRDRHTISSYGENILGVREAIPKTLALFAENDISATWATVGLLFCENKEEIFCLTKSIQKPQYKDQRLSNYRYFHEIGKNESEDKYYFGKSLLLEILDTPNQKVGTHTFSHYYCLETGAEIETFENDVDLAIKLARQVGVEIKSIVFPRNQYSKDFLQSCAKRGITSFRGNPSGYAYKSHNGEENTKLKRALRLVDAHTGLLADLSKSPQSEVEGIVNVPANRFLRPKTGKLGRIHPLHVKTILREMHHAAKSGFNYHLWWHPHNFGINTIDNIAALREIILQFNKLKDEFGFKSSTMEDIQI